MSINLPDEYLAAAAGGGVCRTIEVFINNWYCYVPDKLKKAINVLAVEVIGTGADNKTKARATLASEWIMKVYLPTWLETAGKKEQAEICRKGWASEELAVGYLQKLSQELRAERVSERVEAWNTAWGKTARNAAWGAAWSAASKNITSKQGPTWDAAWAVIWSVARAAPVNKRDHAVRLLQASALDLLTRMVRL
jgi:hypothetical protein